MKKTILFAALLLAAVAPLRAQEWKRVNDTTWTRFGENQMGVYTETATLCDISQLVAENNNRMRSAGLCFGGSMACGAIAGGILYLNNRKGDAIPFFNVLGIGFGIGSLALSVKGCVELAAKRVYLTPEGVVVRITHSTKRKFIEYR